MADVYRYSNLVEAKLRAESIFANLFNNAYESGNPAAGSVKVPVRAEATVDDYDIAQGGTLNYTATSYVTIDCDKDLYVNELVDGYVAAMIPDGVVAERLDSAAYALADAIDNLCITKAATQGTTTGTIATAVLSASTIYPTLVDGIQAVKAEKVNPRKIWVAVSCTTLGMLTKSDEFIKAAGSVADLGAGYRGMISGVPVFESANLEGVADFIIGNGDFCHYVDSWSVPVAVNDLADGLHIGASAVQGRKVAGAKISKAATVIVHLADESGS